MTSSLHHKHFIFPTWGQRRVNKQLISVLPFLEKRLVQALQDSIIPVVSERKRNGNMIQSGPLRGAECTRVLLRNVSSLPRTKCTEGWSFCFPCGNGWIWMWLLGTAVAILPRAWQWSQIMEDDRYRESQRSGTGALCLEPAIPLDFSPDDTKKKGKLLISV